MKGGEAMSLQISHEGQHFGPKTTAESVIFRAEYDTQTTVDKIAERVNRRIDEATLAKVEGQLAEYGYVKVVRCRDCEHATISMIGVCKYCEMWVLPDVDGYGCDSQVNLPLDFFCAYGKRKEVDA